VIVRSPLEVPFHRLSDPALRPIAEKLGAGERLSVPLTWGGTRRAALEVDRTFKRGPFTRLESSIAIWQRENPRFEIDDRRVEWRGRAERRLARFVKLGGLASRSSVSFGELDDDLWTVGADAALDTRADPNFPRNAVYLGTGWTGLHIRSAPERIDLYTTDARGYVTTYFYDDAGRRTKVKNALNQETIFTYDANGNQLTSQSTSGEGETYEYYPDMVYIHPLIGPPLIPAVKRHLIKTHSATSGGVVQATATLTYTFDANDRISTEKTVVDDGTVVIKTYTYF